MQLPANHKELRRKKCRVKKNDEGQGLFLNLHLEEQFEEYLLEKTVSKFIESEIDLSVFDKLYKNTKHDQAAYNPKFLLKVILFSYKENLLTLKEQAKNMITIL